MTLTGGRRRHGLARPYNAASYLSTPTPDATGSAVHPDVIDFGVDGWNGWRYWMAITPYYNTNDDLENPCLLVSADGVTWQVPAGLTNPIYAWPGGTQYNSDPAIAHDPATDEMVLIYRDGDLSPRIARSADGVTWPDSATPITYTRVGEILSPTLVRISASEWWMYGVNYGTRKVQRWTSADLATWAGPVTVTGLDAIESWHLDVAEFNGRFYALVNVYDPDNLFAATSSDGLAWSLNPSPVIAPPSTGWDAGWVYRATLTPHESGNRFHVWYSALGNASWRIGYTQIPLSEWPSPPA